MGRIHVLDLKGFGAAPKPQDRRYTPLDQASLVVRWILQEDLRDLTLVGHSLGGGVALLTALDFMARDPSRIGRLVLVAGIAYPQPISPYIRLLARRTLGPLLLRILPLRRVMRAALRMAYHPAHPVSESHVEAYVQPLRTREGREALSTSAAQLWTPSLQSATERYHEIDLPCLLIWGDSDRVVPLWVGERLASEMPQARLQVVAKCGHMPQEEAADESLSHLIRFMTNPP
jgi:pimeloyl-ACP methyl ester carboxylesterase